MTTNDLIGLVVLIAAPFVIAFLVWMLGIRPRRRQPERTARLAEVLGLPVLELDRVGAWRDGLAIEVRFQAGPGISWHAWPKTVCQASVEPPFDHSFAVSSPRRGAGVTRRWAEGVFVGGPTPEALALAEKLAPLVQAASKPTLPGVLMLEVDRLSAKLVFDGLVFDRETLERGLDEVMRLSRSVRARIG